VAEIQRLQQVVDALRKKAARIDRENVSVIVGYTANYSVFVHEDLEANHPVGQAKFLEQPAREHAGEIARIARTALSQGKTLSEALLLGGLRLQRESMLLAPVDTSAMKNSAFTRIE